MVSDVRKTPPAGGSAPVHAQPNELKFRDRVNPGDAPAVEILVRDTGFFSPDEVGIARELVETFLSQGEASGYQFVFAELNGALVGYTCYGVIPATSNRYDLYWIAVSPRLQRGGIGSWLLRETERRIVAAGGARIYIETSSRAGYAPTQRFYLASNYELAAHLEDFYTDGDGKLIYCKNLRKP